VSGQQHRKGKKIGKKENVEKEPEKEELRSRWDEGQVSKVEAETRKPKRIKRLRDGTMQEGNLKKARKLNQLLKDFLGSRA